VTETSDDPKLDDLELDPALRAALAGNSAAGANWLGAMRKASQRQVQPYPNAIFSSIQRLERADTKDVQQIAASQLELLAAYHQVALAQSSRSFFWALIGSGAGLLLFAVAVILSLLQGMSTASVVPLAAGAIVEVVSGVVFYLFGKTSAQLSAFHSRLEVLQRYLLANSICESLDGEARNTARASLIQEISRTQPVA
jgi:hypothetical protein